MRRRGTRSLPGLPGPRGLLAALLLAAPLLVGCGASQPQGTRADPEQVDAVEAPELGACRVLTPADVAAASNATETVACDQPHTAETFAIGPLPDSLDDAAYDDERMGAFAYDTCSRRFARFLGADESLALRTVLTWAWFRPSEEAWEEGARWYRCDVVGGGAQGTRFADLPETARGLLLGRPDDQWMLCADGDTVAGSAKIPCSSPHQWRAVTTIKLGEPGDPYPGDREVEVTTRDFCSDSVGAWLNYPVGFEYGYTLFHQAEWEAGNRRSVCWARTDQ